MAIELNCANSNDVSIVGGYFRTTSGLSLLLIECILAYPWSQESDLCLAVWEFIFANFTRVPRLGISEVVSGLIFIVSHDCFLFCIFRWQHFDSNLKIIFRENYENTLKRIFTHIVKAPVNSFPLLIYAATKEVIYKSKLKAQWVIFWWFLEVVNFLAKITIKLHLNLLRYRFCDSSMRC